MADPSFVALPGGWARHIKSALLCAVGLERLALAEVRAGFESSPDPRAQLVAENARLRELLAGRDEEIRIKDARLSAIAPRERPHYPPAERFAILELRTKMGWNRAETARRFIVTPPTLNSWMRRLDEDGPNALVQTPVPVNRYPDLVTAVAQQLHAAAPGFGRRKAADALARAGLHLSASTVARMQRKARVAPLPTQPDAGTKTVDPVAAARRAIRAKHPHHVWHIDLTAIATGKAGFWVPWWPFALILRWPFCWHLAFVLDHFSRALVAFAVFKKEPTAAQVCALLDRAVTAAGSAPRHIITDQGSQFQTAYRDWCDDHDVLLRFGAIGMHGSIAIACVRT